ncbi:Dbl homology domain-containing protein [Cunninghamella echinulata]|nr:Dbl homology domain-containing protein [Cunninghamella echinulata]
MKTHAFNDDDLAMIENLNYDDIDEGLIEQEREYQKRESFINQLLTTEQAYSESLDLVINIFLKPLVKNSKQTSFNFLGTQKVVCTEREIKWLFGNFEAIVEVHHTILENVYHLYFQNYGVAMTTYERLTNYQPFKKFIDNAHKNKSLKGATLPSLLQIPAGCIQRYDSIISGLASHTNITHPDYNALISCKQRINKFTKDIFPRMNETDNIDQVIMIQQALIGAPFGVNSRRRLILQGNLSRVVAPTKSVGEERTYILFSDLLVFVRPKQEQQKTMLQYKGHIPLEQARVRVLPESETGGQPFCIEIASSIRGVDNIQSTYVGNSSTHVLHTSSLEEQELWLRKLEYVIARIDRHAARLKGIMILFKS